MINFSDIYCDFDGTITKHDTVNTFFERFASPDWLEFENLWIQGKITSRENAVRQVRLLRNISLDDLEDYIDSIELNEFFLEFLEYIKAKNIKLTILSDGFDLFIQKTLEKYRISDIEFYANHLIYEDNNFNIEFPNYNSECIIGAGMCKCSKVKQNHFCYIGDGTSDLCVAKKADILFATKKLHQFCEEKSIKHYPFQNFRDIMNVLKKEELINE